jgi:hypothetical protein
VGTTRSTQVEFTFPTREAAVAYAERQGLTFVIEGHDSAARVPDPRATNKPCVAEHSSQRTLPANLSLARMQARRDPCNLSKTPDLKRALVNHAAVFRAPREIVGQSSFEHRLQAGTLTRWAWDEYLLQLASDEAMPEGHESSRLDEVKRALLALNELERGDPPVVAGKTRGAGRRAE